MTKKNTLWPITRATRAKHTILRKYLDAWLPILGAGQYAHQHLVLIDGFAGPGRYSGGEPGSPLIMLSAYVDHSAALDATAHFFFIEEHRARCEHLRSEVAKLTLPTKVQVEIIEGSFVDEFPDLIDRTTAQFGQLPPTFAFVDPFGAEEIPAALSTRLLEFPRCEVLVYFPVAFLARFGEQPEFAPILDSLYGGDQWKRALAEPDFEIRKRLLHDMFLAELQRRIRWVRSFEITPAAEAGGNTYYLFFGTSSKMGLRRMKDAMWKVDPTSGERFRDSTLADHPVLFEREPDLTRLQEMLREKFGGSWFTIQQAEEFTLLETGFRDNGHLKPTLRAAEANDALEVQRPTGKRARTFTTGTRMRFA
ncbi:MAG TPA: three-Cys-motif partner protein TcmP [Gaiellaceae bacterium]|nr:three-Cys-motif partner protein TcmP [Gaiellaceae bacterium]